MERKKEIKIRAEIKTKETIAKINKTKSWFFKMINKIDKETYLPVCLLQVNSIDISKNV